MSKIKKGQEWETDQSQFTGARVPRPRLSRQPSLGDTVASLTVSGKEGGSSASKLHNYTSSLMFGILLVDFHLTPSFAWSIKNDVANCNCHFLDDYIRLVAKWIVCTLYLQLRRGGTGLTTVRINRNRLNLSQLVNHS